MGQPEIGRDALDPIEMVWNILNSIEMGCDLDLMGIIWDYLDWTGIV